MVLIPGGGSSTPIDMCSFGELDLELIFRALIGCDAPAEKTVLRFCLGQEITVTPIHCGSFEDLLINLRRSLVLAADGQIAIRLNMETYADGYGLSTCGLCATGTTWTDLANSLFGEDLNGDVWINLGAVCRSGGEE